jgi:hypothetical protein
MKNKKKTIQKEKKIIELDVNPVRDYLQQNPNKKLSVHTLKTILSIKKRKIIFYCENSQHIQRVNPHDVGSYKEKLNVFEYKV